LSSQIFGLIDGEVPAVVTTFDYSVGHEHVNQFSHKEQRS